MELLIGTINILRTPLFYVSVISLYSLSSVKGVFSEKKRFSDVLDQYTRMSENNTGVKHHRGTYYAEALMSRELIKAIAEPSFQKST